MAVCDATLFYPVDDGEMFLLTGRLAGDRAAAG